MNKQETVGHAAGKAFARGTSAVEGIHRSISDLPFAILENVGVLNAADGEIKKIHDESLAAVYSTVRDVGEKIARFAGDLREESPVLGRSGRTRRKSAGRKASTAA